MTQKGMMGRFSKECRILYEGAWGAVEEFKEALEWPLNISKEEMALLPASLPEISSESAPVFS